MDEVTRPLERRSPTGIARERETSADDCITPVEQKGGDMERRSPTGIARERETSADDAPNCVAPVGRTGTAWSAGLRPASRGSAKPAPMHNARRTAYCITPVEQKGGDGLERRSPTGIARERETSADDCITPVEQKGGDGLERRSPTGIARERETSADDCITPVEQKGGDGLERRSPMTA